MKHLLLLLFILTFTVYTKEVKKTGVDLLCPGNTYIIDSISPGEQNNLIGRVEVSRNNEVLGFLYIHANCDNYEGQKISISDYFVTSIKP